MDFNCAGVGTWRGKENKVGRCRRPGRCFLSFTDVPGCRNSTPHCTSVRAGAAATRAPAWASGRCLPGLLLSRRCPNGGRPPPSVNLLVFSWVMPGGLGGGGYQQKDSESDSCQRSHPEVCLVIPRTHLPSEPVAVLGGRYQNCSFILQILCCVVGSKLRVEDRATEDSKDRGLCHCTWGM